VLGISPPPGDTATPNSVALHADIDEEALRQRPRPMHIEEMVPGQIGRPWPQNVEEAHLRPRPRYN
jgi:hypothetical protein